MLPEDNILFKGIDQSDCQRMISCFNADIKTFRSGQKIMDYSDNPDKLGVILCGTAVMVRYDINGVRSIMESLNEQSIFGVYFTFTASQRSGIEIVAETECNVMFVRRSEITKRCEKACQCHSKVVENLLQLMSEKAISLNERIEVLSQRTIEEKLISCLSIIEEKTPNGKAPQIPFSTTALSDYLCVNRSALQREITRLKNNGVLTISKRKFKLMRNRDSDN
ncbi:MAG: Crp/Fnr family transcriptional regulator [Ruminococcus sp.]|uniref:Crp/Fnr family transcriptional regulator n=1 Tax=Ruminococcus sp. TaxID=41978 RepID=UPI0025DAFE5D|nr:Crp/Fnr family transcriptional regulator [Ruminococcus sp.]MCR5601848.1 Crp/Fnr family transcriptional regulator [Ruminococcus sp.]